MKHILKPALVATFALFAARADATLYRMPSTCVGGCMIVSAYYDHGGTKDWNCGSTTYSGHRGTDFAIIGSFTAMDAGRDIVAAADGDVTYTHDGEFDRCTSGSCAGGSGFGNWVKIKHADGRETYYGHMRKGTVAVKVGDKVKCGQKLGQVGSAGYSTGPHLHFEPRNGTTANDSFGKGACYSGASWWVEQGPHKGLPGTTCEPVAPPPNQIPKGQLDGAACDRIHGWSQDPDTAAAPTKVIVTIGGELGAKDVFQRTLDADKKRDDLCGPLGSCDHGFEMVPPLGLLDGKPHDVFAYAIDTGKPDERPKLAGSPKTFTCAPPTPPEGVKRHVASTEVFAAWKFSALDDVAHYTDAIVAKYPNGQNLPSAVELVKSDDGAPEVWVIDVTKSGPVKRHVTDPAALGAWRFDTGTIATWAASKLASTKTSKPWRARPFLVQGDTPAVFVIDDRLEDEAPPIGDDAGTLPPLDDAGNPIAPDGGAANAGAPAEDDAALAGSCGCRVAGTGASELGLVASAIALGVALHRRRRR